MIVMAKDIEDCLKEFIRHVRQLHEEDSSRGNGFWREFKELRDVQVADKAANKFPAEEGNRECNVKKNRYRDIVPYDSHRVVLKKIEGVEGSDYINASFIEDADGKRGYIASQGPLPHTVEDFWRMLWEYKVEIVFMVCREEESRKAKCHRYWANPDEELLIGDYKITLDVQEEVFTHFVRRKLRVAYKEETHCLTQFHYTGWPDHNVPENSAEIYNMVGKMREERRHLDIPLVIHCSAGCGRTGTICAVDFAWTSLDQRKIEKGFSMYNIILEIRKQRQSMVQTPDQYQFVHQVVQTLAEEWLHVFQEHDYMNVAFPTADDDEMYYNTAGFNNRHDENIYQDVEASDVTPTVPHASNKPPLVPKPTHISAPGSNKEVKISGAVDAYENVELKSPSQKVVTKKIPDKSEETKKVSEGKLKHTSDQKAPPESPNKKKHAPQAPAASISSVIQDLNQTLNTKAGHATKIAIVSNKPPPNHHPPPPPQAQTKTHADAVRSLDKGILKDKRTPGNEVMPSSTPVSETYGVVQKDNSGKIKEYPQETADNIRLGRKKKDAVTSTSSTSSSTEGDVPRLPERNYDEKDAFPTTILPDDGDRYVPGMVRAQGGLRGPQVVHGQPQAANRTLLHQKKTMVLPESQAAPERMGHPVVVSSVGRSGTGGHVLIPRLQAGPTPLWNIFKAGRGRPPAGPVLQVSNAGSTQFIFRENDVAFPHRVQKPKGKRQPKGNVYNTYL